jgi:hypothetical protein
MTPDFCFVAPSKTPSSVARPARIAPPRHDGSAARSTSTSGRTGRRRSEPATRAAQAGRAGDRDRQGTGDGSQGAGLGTLRSRSPPPPSVSSSPRPRRRCYRPPASCWRAGPIPVRRWRWCGAARTGWTCGGRIGVAAGLCVTEGNRPPRFARDTGQRERERERWWGRSAHSVEAGNLASIGTFGPLV